MTYYDDLGGYHDLHKDEQLRKMKVIAEHLNISRSDKLLDVGCGSGHSLDFFDCKKIGIDPSEELLKHCKSPTIKGVAEDLPFEDSEFTVVISVSAIHNFEDPEKALQEMKRVGRDKFAITLFKKGKDKEKAKRIMGLIEKHFDVAEMIEDEHDYIFICKSLNNKDDN